jgi:DNA-binding transcriptional MocR family regulator
MRQSIAAARPGERLPSVRELVRRHGVSPVTVQRIVDRLAHEGLVDPVPGRGTFVADRPAVGAGDWSWQTVALGARPLPGEGMASLAADLPADVISLATGYPDASLQAIDLLVTAGARAARRPGVWDRSPVEGLAPLRDWFAADVGGGVRADDVVVIAGGQAALSASFRGLASPGDAVVVEAPTYSGAIEAARLAGLHPVPVATDEHGVRTDLLAAALRASGARLVYLQPTTANPTGVTLPPERRREVLELARTAGAFVIEDDYARDLHHDGRPPAPLLHDDRDGHVVYVRSLTKSAAPALRIAAMVARGPALRRLRNARLVDDFFVSAVLQETALGLVGSPGWPRHLVRLRRAVADRMATAIRAIDEQPAMSLVARPTGGLVLWVAIDDRLDDALVTRRALELGVAVSPGRTWFCAEPTGTFLRLSVAAADGPAITEGIRRLATALAGPA